MKRLSELVEKQRASRRQLEKQVEEKFESAREQIVRDTIMSEEFMTFMEQNMLPMKKLLAYYRCAMMEVETKFRVLNEEFSLQYDRNPIESIKTRLKSQESLLRKIRKRNIPLDVDAIEANITDIAGVRIVCAFPEDIYRLADCLLQQDDVTLIEKKDYIENPKPSGYRSLHLIIEIPIFLQDEKKAMKVEVQFRTIAMDFWASLEHKVRYKKDIPPQLADELAAELLECSELSAELDRRMEAVKNRATGVGGGFTPEDEED